MIPLVSTQASREGTMAINYDIDMQHEEFGTAVPPALRDSHYRIDHATRSLKPDTYAVDGINNHADTCEVWTLHLHPVSRAVVFEVLQEAALHLAFRWWLAGDSWMQWGESSEGDDDVAIHIYFEAPVSPNYTYAQRIGEFIFKMIDTDLIEETYCISTSGDWSIQL
jgi:hypothetical protein